MTRSKHTLTTLKFDGLKALAFDLQSVNRPNSQHFRGIISLPHNSACYCLSSVRPEYVNEGAYRGNKNGTTDSVGIYSHYRTDLWCSRDRWCRLRTITPCLALMTRSRS